MYINKHTYTYLHIETAEPAPKDKFALLNSRENAKDAEEDTYRDRFSNVVPVFPSILLYMYMSSYSFLFETCVCLLYRFLCFCPFFVFVHVYVMLYGVAMTSRLLEIIGLFCKRAL